MKKNYGSWMLMFSLLMPISGAHALSLMPPPPTPPCPRGYILAIDTRGWICVPETPIKNDKEEKDARQGQAELPKSFTLAQEKTADVLKAVSEGNMATGQAALDSLFEGLGGKNAPAAPVSTRAATPARKDTKAFRPRRGFIPAAYDPCFDGGGNCPSVPGRPTTPTRPTPPPTTPTPTTPTPTTPTPGTTRPA